MYSICSEIAMPFRNLVFDLDVDHFDLVLCEVKRAWETAMDVG
jgi:DNA primase catalytic subunit